MTLNTQAGIFAETLEGMRNHERESRKAWLRLQLKARARRFFEGLRTGFNGSRRALVWSRKTTPRHERP